MVLGLAATACASGGGGSGGSSVADPPPPPPPPPPQTSDPGDFETREYDLNAGLELIHASSAYAAGATGEGITIAVIDTGSDPSHPDLQGQILSASFDIHEGSREAADTGDDHGTLVSGIIAAKKDGAGIHGVAFESRILDIRADSPGTCLDDSEDGGCSFFDTDLAIAIARAVNEGAQIINLSLGGPIDTDATLENAIRNAVDRGVLVVISAGNDATPAAPDPDNPGTTLPPQGMTPNEPAYIAGQNASKGLVVAVGSIDLNRKISDFSNRSGVSSMDYYILAPGEDVISTGEDGEYYYVAGTSFAAPYVSGALALMLQAFPNLSPETALQILLDTADDYVDNNPDPIRQEAAGTGHDSVSGVGILNLEAAFTPQEASSMSFGAQQVELSSALSAPSGAFGDWASHSGAFAGLVFQDSYGRGFRLDQFALASPGTVIANLEERAAWTMGQAHAVSAGNLSLAWNQARLLPDPNVPYEREPETYYTARYSFNGGLVEFGRGGRLSSIAPQVTLTQEAGSPGALGGQGQWARVTHRIGRKFSFDAFSADHALQDVTGVGLSRQGDGWIARAAYSLVENGSSALGSTIQSRFGGEDRTSLRALTFETATRPRAGLTLSAGMELAAVSLPDAGAEDVWTSRWSLGAAAPLAGGTINFILAQPRRAEGGTLRFDGPVAVTEEGGIVYQTIDAALVPSGRQIDMETRWNFGLTERLKGTASFAVATSPNHIAAAAPEKVFWLGLGSNF